MRFETVFRELGDHPTATFGIASYGGEVVGPLNPESVDYGTVSDASLASTRPLVHLHFNKYRPDLPPWRDVVEFVLATRTDDGQVLEGLFIDTSLHDIRITGDLKTVDLVADTILDGVENAAVIDRSDGVQQRDEGTSADEFKVTEQLQ